MSELRFKEAKHIRRPSPSLLWYFTALAAAGAAYPMLALLVTVDGPSFGDLPFLIPASFVASGTAFFSGTIVMLGWYACSRFARTPVEPVHYFTAASGLIGVLPLVMLASAPELGLHAGYSWNEVIRLFFFGPGTAIPLCQLAGAWSQCPANVWRSVRRRWRFQIRHVLLATAGIGLALALMKLCGWLSLDMAVWLTAVAIYQWVTLRLVMWFFRWRSPCEIEGGGVNGE